MVPTSTTVILLVLLTLMGGTLVWAAIVNLDTLTLESLRDIPVFRSDVRPAAQETGLPLPARAQPIEQGQSAPVIQPAATPAVFGPLP